MLEVESELKIPPIGETIGSGNTLSCPSPFLAHRTGLCDDWLGGIATVYSDPVLARDGFQDTGNSPGHVAKCHKQF